MDNDTQSESQDKTGDNMGNKWKWTLTIETGKKGGPGSGHHGHVGRPGQVGGSAPGSGMSGKNLYLATDADREEAEDWAIESIEELARAMNTSYEKAERYVFDKLDSDLDNPIIMRRGLESSIKILKEGRFKSQFETGKSGGVFDPELRTTAEQIGLGIPSDIEPQSRPIYGVVDVQGTHISIYGEIEWVLKESVKERATITLGDSLYSFRGTKAVGTPYLNPTTAGFDMGAAPYGRSDGAEGIGYIEVQIQGGVTLKDIAKIRLTKFVPDWYRSELSRLAAENGIEVEAVQKKSR